MPVTISERYSRASIAMHWLMVLFFLGIYSTANLIDVFERGSVGRQLCKDTHFTLGLSVFLLVWLRLVLRLRSSTPPIVPTPPAWHSWLSHWAHRALYLLMVAMPLLGWSVLSAGGKPGHFLVWDIPALLAQDQSLGHTLMDLHSLGGDLGYFLIGGHALAALLHHYVIKDNTLRRMWLR